MTCSAKISRAQIHISEFATPFCRWGKHSKLWEKIKSSVQALKLLWAEWLTLSEHTARFLWSWKKYFSRLSCSIWTQNIRRKSKTCCMCIFGCRIEIAYYWITRKTASDLKSTPYATHWVLKRQSNLTMWHSGHQYIEV